MDLKDLEARCDALFGGLPRRAGGAVHVTAVWQDDAGRWWTLIPGPVAPASPLDALALALGRARADAILTSGANLRSEPRLSWALSADPSLLPALTAYRRRLLGHDRPPAVYILTTGIDLPLTHPALAEGPPVTLCTGQAGAQRLGGRAAAQGIEVFAHPAQGPRAALAEALRRAPGGTISVEAGPTTSSQLYAEPPALAEAMVSIYLGPAPPAAAVGKPAIPPEALARSLPRILSDVRAEDASGPWRFVRRGR